MGVAPMVGWFNVGGYHLKALITSGWLNRLHILGDHILSNRVWCCLFRVAVHVNFI